MPLPRTASDAGSEAGTEVAVTDEAKLSVAPTGAEMVSNSVSENGPGTASSTCRRRFEEAQTEHR